MKCQYLGIYFKHAGYSLYFLLRINIFYENTNLLLFRVFFMRYAAGACFRVFLSRVNFVFFSRVPK